jgi:tRNA threonylcarbamoyladenosine biosynthesis protein TsaE
VRPGDIVVLTGDLGAGKTVIAQGVAEGLGISGHVTSPTFNILVLHGGASNLAHFDLYRLEHAGSSRTSTSGGCWKATT